MMSGSGFSSCREDHRPFLGLPACIARCNVCNPVGGRNTHEKVLGEDLHLLTASAQRSPGLSLPPLSQGPFLLPAGCPSTVLQMQDFPFLFGELCDVTVAHFSIFCLAEMLMAVWDGAGCSPAHVRPTCSSCPTVCERSPWWVLCRGVCCTLFSSIVRRAVGIWCGFLSLEHIQMPKLFMLST